MYPYFLTGQTIDLILSTLFFEWLFNFLTFTIKQDGHYALHLAATNGHTEVVRCLCLAGCRIDVKNDQGVSAEIAALAQGHKDTSDLLKRLKRVCNIPI